MLQFETKQGQSVLQKIAGCDKFMPIFDLIGLQYEVLKALDRFAMGFLSSGIIS